MGVDRRRGVEKTFHLKRAAIGSKRKLQGVAFLLMIAMLLIADGFGLHIPKGYVYAAMGFSVMVETLNLLAARRRRKP